jgi:hypothetical protein
MTEIEDIENNMKTYMQKLSTSLANVLYENLTPEEIQEKTSDLVRSFLVLRESIAQSKINEIVEANSDNYQLQNLSKDKTEALVQYNEMRKNIGRLFASERKKSRNFLYISLVDLHQTFKASLTKVVDQSFSGEANN